ncbi:MAG: hypothetical protein R3182_12020, partial [Draconibacterium sp.]|nr:hypothetical protein [Draconibacterium sp.]
WSCRNIKTKEKEQVVKESSGLKRMTTRSGKIFIVHTDYSKGKSICGLKIETRGFEIVNDTYDFGDTDPVENVFLADLDGNGFEEIYITTRSAGSGSYSKLYGMASNKDKSATSIYVKPVSQYKELFPGFMGHNEFKFDDGKLFHQYPVYKNDDKNSKPSGGIRKIEYRLIPGEDGWILEPVY